MSNYHSFGDMKFVPELSVEKFWGILSSHPEAENPDSLINHVLTNFRQHVDKEVFAYEDPYKQLNFPHDGGVTAYFSRNMTMEELELVKEFLLTPEAVDKGLDILNTRVFKQADNDFLITVASITQDGSCTMQYKDKTFNIQFGEFAEYLKEMNHYLEKALPYAANEHQELMIQKYIESYTTGSIPVHKDS